jgi:hypothetical protein
MSSAYWVSQMIYATAKLGLADIMADGPKTAAEIAPVVRADAGALARMLRGLTMAGVLAEVEGGHYALAPPGEGLRSDQPGSVRNFVIMLGEEHYKAWGDFLQSVRTGRPAFPHVYGMELFRYLAQTPAAAGTFHRAMKELTAPAFPELELACAAERPGWSFSQYRTIVDVGGGYGGFVTFLLNHHPSVRGILFDLPHAVATGKKYVESAGLSDRCEVIGGDFFESVPTGGDAYVLQLVLHNWEDDRATAILQGCRRAMGPKATLYLIEYVVPLNSTPHISRLLDLDMLVMLGGRERTEAEHRALLAAGGFELQRVTQTESRGGRQPQAPVSLIEAVPV